MKKTSVVIPNYNGEKFIKECFDALNRQDTKDFDVIVVDNGSTDRSMELVKKYSGNLEVQTIYLKENYGFSRAVNEGIKASTAMYVILLNNDTRVGTHFVAALTERIESDSDIFSAQAHMLKYDDRTLTDSAGDFFTAMGWAFARGKDKPASQYKKECDIFSSCAGAAIYRKSAFEKIGYFDENFFAYLEDVDIGFRARLYGYRNVFAPKAKVLHVGSGSSGSRYNSFKVRLSARNSMLVIYKNFTKKQKLINFGPILLGVLIKTVFFWTKHLGAYYLKGIFEAFSMFHKMKKTEPMEGFEEIMGKEIERELLINTFKRLM